MLYNICYMISVNIYVNICIYIYTLVGGLEYVFYFSIQLGIIIPID